MPPRTQPETRRETRSSPRRSSHSLETEQNRREEEQGEEPASSFEQTAPSTSSTRPTRSSRHQAESTHARRSSRRTSLDPYPTQSEPTPERRRRTTRSQPQSTEEPAEQEIGAVASPTERQEQEMQDVAEEATTGEATESTKGRHFELSVLQQPEIGAEAGLGKVTLGRLPIVPAPVVQLIVKDESGKVLDIEMPYLFCSCSLRDAEGTTTIELAPTASSSATQAGDDELSALVGNLVRNPHRVQDLEGNTVSVFVFEDMSVRMQGKFTLEFSLGEARQAQSPKLAAIVSEPFDVVEWKNYPGRPAADTVPELSMHLHSQGVPMYIPPLVLSQPTGSPPPPSTNPFPANHWNQEVSTGEVEELEQPAEEGDAAPEAPTDSQ